ncbi:uncharacterized protein K452DRAFT_148663 [Aplosporella prunicola CBS 121167]|uniref:Uncharacterized protein n=1 Tax=Aplosporella prunicola CBS 121167 TaxID=1176127 RepID=A0A6A6AZ78_9PEZI|nr:uncharacterized protein K452DRAFT_148663 [Aplosporella prunicola CBS 121167]KAF2136087.1 hypothetical protein K452DRAFT_148663 [Aplosporella prunicola CBS 121167]
MAFDLKGAFNAVNKEALDNCLGQRRIPSQARKWISSFISDRSASISFDGFTKPASTLSYPGLL